MATDAQKNDPRFLRRLMNCETFSDSLNAYSLLFFAILGVDGSQMANVFQNSRLGRNRRSLDCSRFYLDFYRKLSESFYESARTSPFAMIPLKHFICCASDLLPKHRTAFMEAFSDIAHRFVPRLKQYLSGAAATDCPILAGSPVLAELQIEADVLLNEASHVARSGELRDKTIKYDEGARG